MRYLQLDDKLIEKICSYVKRGICFRDAYQLAGIHKKTGTHWRGMAKKDIKKGLTNKDSLYIKLSEAMDKAKVWKYGILQEAHTDHET